MDEEFAQNSLDNLDGYNEADLDSNEGFDDFDSYQAFLEDLDADALTELELLDDTYVNDDEELFGLAEDEFVIDFLFDDPNLSPEVNAVHNIFTPRLKSKGVNYEGVTSQIKDYLSSLPEEYRSKIVITSGADGTHAKNSRHYRGEAVDLRYDQGLHEYIARTAGEFGLKTINPNHGTAPHTHLQVMQMGGFNIGDWQDPYAMFIQNSIQNGMSNLGTSFTNNPNGVAAFAGSNYQAPTTPTPIQNGSGFNAGNVSKTAGLISGVANTIDQIKEKSAKVGQAVFNTANSAMDTAINILGQGKQAEELRRLQQMRAEDTASYQAPNPPIRNIPVYR